MDNILLFLMILVVEALMVIVTILWPHLIMLIKHNLILIMYFLIFLIPGFLFGWKYSDKNLRNRNSINSNVDIARYYIELIKWILISIILLQISLFIIFFHFMPIHFDNYVTVCEYINNTNELIMNSEKSIIELADSNIPILIFTVYFTSSIYLIIKKPLKIVEYSPTTIKLMVLTYSPLCFSFIFLIVYIFFAPFCFRM